MRLAILAMLLMLSIASAETVHMKDYTADFNISDRHITSSTNTSFMISTFFGRLLLNTEGRVDSYLDKVGYIDSKDSHGTMRLWQGLIFPEYEIAFQNYTIYSTMDLNDTINFVRSLEVRRNPSLS